MQVSNQPGNQPLSGKLSGIQVAILVAEGFEQDELTASRHALEEAGALTRIVSLRPGTIRARRGASQGDEFDVALPLDAADPQDFDALVLPGGAESAKRTGKLPQARQFVQAMQAEGKPVAAVSHGCSLLITSGLAKGHVMTGAAELQRDALAAGARWEDLPVVVDGNLVSGRGLQDDLGAFAHETVEAICRRVSENVAGTEDENLGAGTSS